MKDKVEKFLNSDRLIAKEGYVYANLVNENNDEEFYFYNEPEIEVLYDNVVSITNYDETQFEVVEVINENLAKTIKVTYNREDL